ncbi:ABC transporter substrate-binding protein [Bacillota bacterium Meth-B3]|nr:ABC transporter substrate-binding protein [Christensenellaceae bacterium]MEA5066940.1 ABC transporter substrate-binding protein [Eubacteriales bacterium]MEA5067609.1 ABC transporter substrate-binding protein [Christensenellaceae bacterium]
MKRAMLAALLTLLMMTAGCAGGAPAPEPKNQSVLLGFAQLGSESAWRVGNSASIKQAADAAGVQLMFENAEQKQEKQIKALRSFIAYQVDVIAFAPIVEDGWDNVLLEAKAAGIPVLTTDRMIVTEQQDLYAGFVGSDFYQEGVRAGEFLIKKTGGRSSVNIVEISGTLDSTPMRQRARGFRDVIAGDPRFHIVDSLSGDFLRSKGKERMEQLLDRYENIDVLYSHNDGMTLGAIEAIEARGIRPGTDIVIITVDGEQAAINLLKEGKINCVVECTPLIGDTVMRLAKRLAAGETIPRMTYSDEQVFTEFDGNLDSLPARGY